MAARATWKGFLKISLVNIPIKVFPATESSGSISFNQLHGECQTRIQHQRGIVMHTLHHAAEIRSIDAVEELNSVPAKVKPEETKLARQVIETFEQPLNLSDYKDEYREGLQRIIDAKIAGEEVVATTA